MAAGVLTISQAAPLVRLRALAMQEAVPVGVGTMSAIISAPSDAIELGIVPRFIARLISAREQAIVSYGRMGEMVAPDRIDDIFADLDNVMAQADSLAD